ncbi:MAG: IS91 family transposase [Spirochaetales bacterium]|nr:IS91 family transposase [Spirochaetales bacterium]
MSKLGEIAMIGKTLPDLNKRERQVLSHIADCHTERMGSNTLSCECGNREIHYNSCRDRHCPLCQGAARAKWVRERLNELLPVSYFHVVFTIPKELHSLARANHKIFYKALFQSVHNTLLEVCANKENLGGRIGGLSVLHTWTQKLTYHPHLHCIVPSGGVSPDGKHWIVGNSKYLVPVKKLSAVFRGKLLSALRKYCDRDELFGNIASYNKALYGAASKPFVVYAKKPFGSPAQVIKYLGRYTHRVGISEQRIVSINEKNVCFTWLDRAGGHKRKKMTLSHSEFVHRFLFHLLPRGMRKIRYFGYMSNRDRQNSIEQVRQLIGETGISCAEGLDEISKPDKESDDVKPGKNLCCKCGREMSLWGHHEIESLPDSEPGWLGRRLEKRRNIHGPEPNKHKAS